MWIEIGLAVLLLVAALQLLLLLRLARKAARLEALVGQLGQSAVHAATDVPTSMLVTALGGLERRLAMLELPAAQAPRAPYDLAQQLARDGAGVEQLVERCGLSRDEARLIVQMHAASQP